MLPMPSSYSIHAGAFPNARTVSRRMFEFRPSESLKLILKDMKTSPDQNSPYFSTISITLDNSAEMCVIFEQAKIQYFKQSLSKVDQRFNAKAIFRMDSKEGIDSSNRGCALSHLSLAPHSNHHFRVQTEAFVINRSNVNLTALKLYLYVENFFIKEELSVNFYEGGFPVWRLKVDQTYRLEVGADSEANIYLMEFFNLPSAKV